MKPVSVPEDVHGELPRAVRAWLSLEQGVNERIRNEGHHPPIAADLARIPAAYHPLNRTFFPQEVRFLRGSEARRYGDVRAELGAFAKGFPDGDVPLFEHPWPAPKGRRGERHATGILSTPTSSFRSVLSWKKGQRPFILKLSLDTVIGTVSRVLREDQIARGLVVARVLDTVPAAHRKKLSLEWFDERAGVVEAKTRTGWLLRTLPPSLVSARDAGRNTLVPAFSLISRQGEEPPLLVEMIRASGLPAAHVVMKHVLHPYVSALAYLLFEHGVETEGHSQNVLFEMSPEGTLTGKLVLRDWSDTSVNWALRIARRKPLEDAPPRALRPRGAPYSLVSIAAGHSVNGDRAHMLRAGDTVERYGLLSFVWAFATSLERYFPDYPRAAVERAFLKLWQGAATQYLGCTPEIGDGPRRIAVDEAVFHSLAQTPWETLPGYGARALLPSKAEDLRLGPPARRKTGRAYARIETPVGDLFLDGPRPAYLRPAF